MPRNILRERPLWSVASVSNPMIVTASAACQHADNTKIEAILSPSPNRTGFNTLRGDYTF